MNTIPDLEYTPPALTSEILERMLDKLYNISFIAKNMASEKISTELREECAECIREETLRFGRSFILLKEAIDGMDSQIKNLIAHAKSKTTPGLN